MKINCEYTELVDLHKLTENPKNANKHSKEQIERLAKLLDFQGWRHPIIVSKRSGFVVAGHGRLLAAKHLGWTQAPVDYQEFETEATEYSFLVSDNEIARWAELDEEKLMQDLQDLDLGDIDLLGLQEIPDVKVVELPDLDSDDPQFQQVTFVLSNEQKSMLDDAMEKASKTEDCSDGLNQNKNGNTISAIIKRYLNG